MKRSQIIVLAALAAVLAGTVLAYLLNPQVKRPVIDYSQAPTETQDGKPRVKGLSYTHVVEGVRRWTLSSKGARIDEDKKEIALTDVRVTFYPAGGGWMTMDANEGVYNQASKDIEMRGNVRGLTHNKITLATEFLRYSEAKQIADTNLVVVIAGPQFRVKGKGMIVYIPERRAIMKKEVDSVFTPEGKGPPPGATLD